MSGIPSRKMGTDYLWIQPEDCSDGDGAIAYVGFADMDREDTRRLVACWNVCDRIPTELIEELELTSPHALASLLQHHGKLLRQRDAVYNAVMEISAWECFGEGNLQALHKLIQALKAELKVEL